VGDPLQARVTAAGELQLRGASGFGGYYRDETATQAAMEDGWFRTGDAIRVHQGEQFVFMDRVKDLRQLSNGLSFPPQYIENQLRASPYIRDAIAIGDSTRPFVTVLVNIDQGIVGRHAERIGLAWSTFADLSQLPQVHELVAGTLRRINDMLEPHARVIRFAAFPKELDADDSELTRSRKLRREVIETRYAPVIDAMYEGRASCPVEVLVKYQDGTQARIRQDVRITAVGQ
jgi:long-chain acyl-CoA synthetase